MEIRPVPFSWWLPVWDVVPTRSFSPACQPRCCLPVMLLFPAKTSSCCSSISTTTTVSWSRRPWGGHWTVPAAQVDRPDSPGEQARQPRWTGRTAQVNRPDSPGGQAGQPRWTGPAAQADRPECPGGQARQPRWTGRTVQVDRPDGLRFYQSSYSHPRPCGKPYYTLIIDFEYDSCGAARTFFLLRLTFPFFL